MIFRSFEEHSGNYVTKRIGKSDRSGAAAARRFLRRRPLRVYEPGNRPDDWRLAIYAGSEIECAVYETIFHDVPVKALMKSVRKKNVVIRSHTELKVQRPLNLVALFNPDLKAWRITRDALTASTPEYCTDTAKWAEAVHKNFPEADGLVWTSNHCDPQLAYLFFGDRVAEGDFPIKSVRDGKVDSSFLADVRLTGQRAGITITL